MTKIITMHKTKEELKRWLLGVAGIVMIVTSIVLAVSSGLITGNSIIGSIVSGNFKILSVLVFILGLIVVYSSMVREVTSS